MGGRSWNLEVGSVRLAASAERGSVAPIWRSSSTTSLVMCVAKKSEVCTWILRLPVYLRAPFALS